MQRSHNRNLGKTNFPKKRRSADPMASYDALPPELREWLMHACLPWSPASCLKIWRKVRREGASPTDVMQHLNKIENAMLQREQASTH